MNPTIGDKALDETYKKILDVGSCPPKLTESDKIRCHLSYALHQLRVSTNHELPDEQSETLNNRRLERLLSLESYIESGRFPSHRNANYRNERKPCFVDSHTNTPCAVAYMMLDSGESSLVDTVMTRQHQYDTIYEMTKDNVLMEKLKLWAMSNGFQLSELALIQPTYEFVAKKARELFADLEYKLNLAAESSKNLKMPEVQNLSREIVRFGDQMRTQEDYTRVDTPMYLKALEKLSKKIPSNDTCTTLQALINVLRKEVEIMSKPEDFIGLLSDEDIEAWKGSNIYNSRLGKTMKY